MPLLIALLALGGGVAWARGTLKPRGKILDTPELSARFQQVMLSGNPTFMRIEGRALFDQGYLDAADQLFSRATSIDGQVS
jgi:hypothetical protein